jgi:hypothetical protein
MLTQIKGTAVYELDDSQPFGINERNIGYGYRKRESWQSS